MKKEIGTCLIGENKVVLQINDNRLEFILERKRFSNLAYAIDLDKVWEDVKPFFIDKIKELKAI
jgi:hypothetical protein